MGLKIKKIAFQSKSPIVLCLAKKSIQKTLTLKTKKP